MPLIALSIASDCAIDRDLRALAGTLDFDLIDRRSIEHSIAEACDHGSIDDRFNVWHATGRWLSAPTGREIMCRLTEETLELAGKGDVLLLSWAAPAILRHLGHAVSIRVHAPSRMREMAAMRRLAYRAPLMAEWEVGSADTLIERFMRRMFDHAVGDPALYDVMLNVGRLPNATWTSPVVDFVRRLPQYSHSDGRAEVEVELRMLRQLELTRTSCGGAAVPRGFALPAIS